MDEEIKTPNASDPEQVKAGKRKAKRISERAIADLKQVMDTPHGRRFIWGLLEYTGIYRCSFTGNSTTFFNEGQRNVGLKYLNDVMTHCAEQYLQAMKENKQEEKV